MKSTPIIAVIGAGFTGLAAAHYLSISGFQVKLFESTDELGGLAGSFEFKPGVRVEKFYHHWYTSDSHILNLIKELGCSDQIVKSHARNGLFFANSIYRLTTPIDLLRLPALPFLDRIRTGLMVLRTRALKDWRALDSISAEEWLIREGGIAAYNLIWKPLLYGKFGIYAPQLSASWFWSKITLRGLSRNKQGKETLLYFRGGFQALLDILRASLVKQGVEINLCTPVEGILVDQNTAKGISTPKGEQKFDAILATVPLPILPKLAPQLSADYLKAISQIEFLGNVCLVLRLTQSLSSTYWINVTDPSFPFVGVIEHTNFDDKANYDGNHIAYISRYLPVSDPYFQKSEQEVFEFALPFLKRMFPLFETAWVLDYKVWRENYSQPVIKTGYSKLIPPYKTPIKNLWLSTMAQIFPEDRGTNFAVRGAKLVADEIAGSFVNT